MLLSDYKITFWLWRQTCALGVVRTSPRAADLAELVVAAAAPAYPTNWVRRSPG